MKLRRRKLRARVEMLPLMDVVFLLLVFFIYSMMSMAVHRALPLNLPGSSQAEISRETSLSLSIAADGALYLDKKTVSLEELPLRLAELNSAQNPDKKPDEELALQIFADGKISYQELYRVLDAIKLSGVSKITLQAEKEKARP